MSLGIIVTTNEGNIFAADSMETYRNAVGDVRESSNTRSKLFQLTKRVGALACGLAFLENKSIEQHMNQFKIENNLEELDVKTIVEKLYDHFFALYQQYLVKTAENAKKAFENRGIKNIEYKMQLESIQFTYDEDGKKQYQNVNQPVLEFLIAGQDRDKSNSVYKVTIPDPKEKNGIILRLGKDQTGAAWIGQTDVLIRIIRGWSPEIKRIKAFRDLSELKRQEAMKQIDDQEYIINWGTMTLQDGVEFCNLAIKVTEYIQKVTDGTWSQPGSSPGVGGAVDVAVSTPAKGFFWLHKKKIKLEGTILDPEKISDLDSNS